MEVQTREAAGAASIQWPAQRRKPDDGCYSAAPCEDARRPLTSCFAALARSPASTTLHAHEENRHQQQREDDDGDHAAHDAGAERLLTGAAGPRRDHHRQYAADKGEARHHDGTEAQAACLDGRLQ
jgi:hypothetical protein